MLNELGYLLENRLERKMAQIINFRDKQLWEKCIFTEGEISALEDVWMDLMQRGLLTD